jgi:hypothetical protein
VLLVLFLVRGSSSGGDQWLNGKNKGRLNEVSDVKEWKRLLKTKTNVLIAFLPGPRREPVTTETLKVLTEVSDIVKGIGTVVTADCSTS